jgi:hypothetical protein
VVVKKKYRDAPGGGVSRMQVFLREGKTRGRTSRKCVCDCVSAKRESTRLMAVIVRTLSLRSPSKLPLRWTPQSTDADYCQ